MSNLAVIPANAGTSGMARDRPRSRGGARDGVPLIEFVETSGARQPTDSEKLNQQGERR